MSLMAASRVGLMGRDTETVQAVGVLEFRLKNPAVALSASVSRPAGWTRTPSRKAGRPATSAAGHGVEGLELGHALARPAVLCGSLRHFSPKPQVRPMSPGPSLAVATIRRHVEARDERRMATARRRMWMVRNGP
jgi:hypothetical protein